MARVMNGLDFNLDEKQLIVDALCLYRWKFVDRLATDKVNAFRSMEQIEHIIDTIKESVKE